jgi:hypothetical protein
VAVRDRNRICQRRAFEKPAKAAQIDDVEGYLQSPGAAFSVGELFLVALSVVER